MTHDLYCWFMQKCFNSRFILIHPSALFGRPEIVRRIQFYNNQYGFWSNTMGRLDPNREFHVIGDDGYIFSEIHMVLYDSWEPYIPFETRVKEKKVPLVKPKFPTYNK